MVPLELGKQNEGLRPAVSGPPLSGTALPPGAAPVLARLPA